MSLDEDYKNSLIERYKKRFNEFGYHFKSVGWGSRETQILRFKILTQIADLSGCCVTDLGCGFGDLYTFLKKHFEDVKYTGIDLVDDFVDSSKGMHPNGKFLVQDILNKNYFVETDFYLISGTLNSRIENNTTFTKEILSKAFSMSKKGLAVNFLSKYVDYEMDKDFHHSPEDVLSFAKGITKYATIRHDYPLWEFTLYMYKKEFVEDLYND